PPDKEFRARLEDQADAEGTGPLYAEFLKTDPESAAKVHPNDRKRIIRGLEIHHQTGLTKSEFESRQSRPPWQEAFAWFGLQREWEDLDGRIDGRVDSMMEEGLAGEVQRLLDAGLTAKHTALQALGYKEMAHHLKGITPL